MPFRELYIYIDDFIRAMHDAHTPTAKAKILSRQVSTLQMSGTTKCNHPPCSRNNESITACLRKTIAPSHVRLHLELGRAVCIDGGLLGYAAVALACLAREGTSLWIVYQTRGQKGVL